jgi:hypothetical protein
MTVSASDYSGISAALGVFKTALDMVRSALSTLKEAKEMLPGSTQKEHLTKALDEATDKIKAGEAALASALGYSLCRCSFPPVPRLLVGYLDVSGIAPMDRERVLAQQPKVGGPMTGSIPVDECPKCKSTDAPGYTFERFC